MTAFLAWLVRLIGLGGVAFVALALFVYGIPGASRIPYLTSIPVIGDFTAGRMNTYAQEQVKLALRGYVLESEKAAAEAKVSEMERQRNAALQSLEEYRKLAVADEIVKQDLEAKLEKAIQDDNSNAGDGDYRWSDADRVWLCLNGAKDPSCRR